MSFFDGRPFRPEPEPERPPQPDWLGPPNGTIGGYVADRLVLIRSPKVALVIDGLRCFPTGVAFDQQLWIRRDGADFDHFEPPWERGHQFRPFGAGGGAGVEPALRLGVAFSDGSTWSNLDVVGRFDPQQPPPSPQVFPRGGSGGGGGEIQHWDFSAWLWPLPPPGPVRFVASWPELGIDEVSAEISGDVLRDAAARAETLLG